jgi:predicted flap endonuclease-1-like 5' DNA nuclease
MTTAFDANLVPILIAVLVGIVIAWWVFKRRPAAHDDSSAPPLAPSRGDTPQGDGLADQGAAATADVPGQLLGVQAHAELAGASGPPDNLQTMKGVGPKLADRLNALGIVRFDQLARLSANEVDIVDAQLGPFKGRVARDRLVEQAAYLARGDTDGFQARFGNLGTGAL